MNNEEELKGEIVRLKQEIEHLKHGNKGVGQALKKRSAEVAGERSEVGIFTEEVRSIGMSDGMEKKELKITQYFSPKGRILIKGKVWRCTQCNTILTEVEKIESNNNVYCEACYRIEGHDLDRDDFKVLTCVSNGFTSTSSILEYFGWVVTIQKITGLAKDEVLNKIEQLLDRGYLFLHGLLFKETRISSKGEEALSAFNQIYRDEDCNLVKQRVLRMGV